MASPLRSSGTAGYRRKVEHSISQIISYQYFSFTDLPHFTAFLSRRRYFYPPLPDKQVPRGPGNKPRGFALVVTVSLMVLLALLAVGLLSLSTVALRSSNQSLAMAEAQANARLALMLAVGELQKAAGPDQRVTAIADIAAGINGARAEAGAAPVNDPSLDGTPKGLTAVQPGTRYWTGVFRNSSTRQSIFEKTPGAVVSQWLVSGRTAADRSPGNPACVVDSSGAVADTTQAAVLIGPGTVGEGVGAADRCVAAPMVPVSDGQRATGGFAWWVGDEGVKARLDMASTPAPADGIRLAIARRRGWETVDGFGAYPVPTDAGDESLRRIVSLPSAPLLLGELSKGMPNPLQLNFHSATVCSQGVIADCLNGGVRVDLSTALAGTLPVSVTKPVYDNHPVAGGRVIPQSAHPKLDRLRWDRLREFYQLHDNLENGALVVSPGNGASTPAIAPSVIDYRILMGVRLVRTTSRDEIFRLHACGKFSVSVANPHTVPMQWDQPIEFEIKNMTPLGNRPSRIWQHQECVYIPHDGTPDKPAMEPAVFNQAMFTIPPGRLQPGEARAYTIAENVLRRIGTANRPVTVTLAPFERSSPFDFNRCVEMETNTEITLPRSMDIRESWQSTLVMLEMRLAGSRGRSTNYLRRFSGFELDNGYFSPNTRRFESTESRSYSQGPVPLMLYSFQISQPGMEYDKLMPAGYEMGQRASTIRTFADFNLRASEWVDAISSYNPPPFFMESNDSIAQLGTSPGNTGPGFTRNLAFSPLNWGYSSAEGSTRTVLFDVPEHFVSLAQFQHADLTSDDQFPSVSVQPGNALANSYFSTFVRRDTTRQERTDYILMGSLNPSGAYQTKRNYYDMSYILNASIWDRYFLSTLAAGSSRPVNPTMLVLDESSKVLGDPAQAAGELMIDGAFNINSTDKNAWKAFLASARHLEVGSDKGLEAAFPRSLRQPAKSAMPPTGSQEDSYAGFRRLSDAQLDRLAEEIVRQVRLRGPFVSLAHFVNRALVPLSKNAQLCRSGALQAAIDAAGINISPDGRASGFGQQISPAEDQVSLAWKLNAPRADLDGGDTDGRPPDAISQEPDWAVTSRDNNYGAVASIIADRETLSIPRTRREQGFRSTGIPGWLTQADVLQVIGPAISSRSDTFRIRAMGEARDATGKVIATAYCEAILQRLPDYVDPSNLPHERGTDLTAANLSHGRRFTITSFRWLAPSEV